MKLQSVEYNINDENWHTIEYVPSNPRSIILYTLSIQLFSELFISASD